jgi:tetratricopeptide (TPR) repeat protein
MNVADEKGINSPDMEAYQAMKLLESGDNQGAVQKCAYAIEHFGDNRNCYLVKARAHIEQEEYGFAEEALQNVLRLDPEHPAAWAMLGEVYFRMGRETKVEYCRSRLEDIFPALTESLEQESRDFEETDNAAGHEDEEPDEEVTQQSEIIRTEDESQSIVPLEDLEVDPAKLDALESRSNNGYSDPGLAGDGIEGFGDFRQQGALKSELFETATFADICISQGKYEKALKIYNRLLQNDPENQRYREKLKLINENWEENES